MLSLFRIFSVLWFAASIYWIYVEPTNFEPKVSLLGACVSLLSFASSRGAEVFITLHNESTPTHKNKFMLHIENKGDKDANDFQVVFPPTCETYDGEIETIPKCLRAGETKKIEVIRYLGSPHQYAFQWSWRGLGWRRHTRTSTVQVQ